MAIEISHDLKWQYRQNEQIPRALDRRPNKAGARWHNCWSWYSTEEAARRALLAMVKDDADDD